MADTSLRIVITAVNNVKAELEKIRQDVKQTTDVFSKVGAGAGAGLKTVAADFKRTGEAAAQSREELEKIGKTNTNVSNSFGALSAIVGNFASVAKLVAGGFLAIEGVGFAKGILDTAARAQVLGVVLNQVGKNAGYSGVELAETDKAVQKLGITAASSRESLTKLIQSDIPVNFGAPLARAAQDLAVISGLNSSDTFSRLITNIQQLDTQGLRFMGIMINKEQVFAKAAEETGRAIVGNVARQVFANAVLAESAKLTGIYETSLGSAGKALTSLPRFVEALKVSLGTALLPAYLALIEGSIKLLKSFDQLVVAFGGGEKQSKLFGTALIGVRENSTGLAGVITLITDSLGGFVKGLEFLAPAIKIVFDGFLAAAAAFAIFKTAVLVGTSFQLAAVGIASIGGSILKVIAVLRTLAATSAIAGAALGFAFGPITLTIIGLTAALAAAYSIYKLFFTKEGTSAASSVSGAVDSFLANLKKEEELLIRNAALQDEIRKARNKLDTALPGEKEGAAAALAVLEVRSTALKKQITETAKESQKLAKFLEDNAGKVSAIDKKRIETDIKAAAAKVKIAKDEEKFLQDLSEALKKAGIDASKYASGIGEQFSAIKGGVESALEGIGKSGIVTASALDESVRGLAKLAGEVSNQAEYEKFLTLLGQLGAKAKEFGVDVAGALGRIKEQGSVSFAEGLKKTSAGDEALLARQRALMEAAATAAETIVKNRNAKEKAAADLSLVIDKDRYDKGLLLLGEFSQRKADALKKEAENELALGDLVLKNLARKLATTTDPAARVGIQQSIDNERNKVEVVKTTFDQNVIRQNLENAETRRLLILDVRKLRNELLALSNGGLEAAIDDISLKFENLRRAIGGVKDAAVSAAITMQEGFEKATATQEFKNQKLQKEVDLQNSLINLASARITRQKANGSLTDNEAQVASNALIKSQIEAQEALIKAQEASIALEEKQFGQSERIDAAKIKINEYKTQIEQLNGSLETTGSKIKEAFQGSLQSNLQALISGTKGFRKALKDLANDINNQILGSITKNFSQQITRTIDNLGKGPDGKGTGIFDQIGEFIFGAPTAAEKQAKIPLGDPNKPITTVSPEVKQALEDLKTLINAPDTPINTGISEVARQAADIARNTRDTVNAINASKGSLPAVPDKGEVLIGTNGQVLNAPADATKNIALQDAVSAGVVSGVKNAPFDFATANQRIGRKDRNIPVPSFNDQFDTSADKAGLGQFGLNGDFLRFLALKESGFNPNANSGQAKGIAQFTPATFKGLGFDEKDILDPRVSIEASAKLMRQLLDQFNGDLDQALAAYNAGPKVALARASGDFTKQSTSNREQTDDYVNVLGTKGVGGNGTSGIKEFTGFVAPKLEEAAMAALSKAGPGGRLLALVLRGSGISGKVASGLSSASSALGGVPFKPNVDGVPRKGAYEPFEADFPPPSPQVLQKVSDASEGIFDSLTTAFEVNANDVSSGLSTGDFGIGDLFSGLGDSLAQGFEGLKSLFDGFDFGGGGEGGGGGGGFDFSSLFSLFAEDGGLLQGPSHSGGGIPVEAEGGEYIINKRSTSRYLPLLHMINEEGRGQNALRVPSIPKFADGGLVDGMVLGGAGRGTLGNNGQGRSVVVQMNVTTPDVASFRKSQDQLAVDSMRMANRAVRRNG